MLSCLESTQFHLILDCNLQIEKKSQQYLGKSEEVFPVKVTLPHLHLKVKHQPSCKLSIEMKSSSIQIRTFQYPSSISVRVSRTKNIQICPRGLFVSTNCHWGNTYQVDVTDCWLIHSHTRQSVHGAVALKISIIQADCTNCLRLKDRKLIIMQISRSMHDQSSLDEAGNRVRPNLISM